MCSTGKKINFSPHPLLGMESDGNHKNWQWPLMKSLRQNIYGQTQDINLMEPNKSSGIQNISILFLSSQFM